MPPGPPGAAGTDGQDGAQGPEGPQGPAGPALTLLGASTTGGGTFTNATWVNALNGQKVPVTVGKYKVDFAVKVTALGGADLAASCRLFYEPQGGFPQDPTTVLSPVETVQLATVGTLSGTGWVDVPTAGDVLVECLAGVLGGPTAGDQLGDFVSANLNLTPIAGVTTPTIP